MRTRFAFIAGLVALCLYFSAAASKAETSKQTIKVVNNKTCRANCDAEAKRCSLEQKVSLNTCIGTKNICYGLCTEQFPTN